MADKDISIRLTTEGDTSGADEVRDALKDTRTESQKLQAERDVEAALVNKALAEQADELAEVAKNTRDVAIAQRVMFAVGASEAIARTVDELKNMVDANSDAERALDAVASSMRSVSAGMQTFIATGNPYAAAAATAATGVYDLIGAYKEMALSLELLDRHEKRFQASMTTSAERRAQVTNEIRRNSFAETLEADARALREFNDEVERLRGIEAARGRLDDATAAAGGESRGDRAARTLSVEANRAAEEEAAASERVRLLADSLSTTQRELSFLTETAGSSVAEIEAARARMEQADELWRNAIRDRDAIAEKNAIELQAAAVEASSTASEDAKNLVDGMVERVRQSMADTVEQSGGRLQADAAGAIQRFTDLATDAIPNNEQLPALLQELRIFRGSHDAFVAGMSGNIDDLISGLSKAATNQDRQKTQIQQILGRLEALENTY